MADKINLRFDGRAARENRIDMGLLGRSLIGADRIIRDGLFIGVEGRLPRRRERIPVLIEVEAPRDGSVDIYAVIANASGVLPIIHEMLVSTGVDYVKHLFSFVLLYLGGRQKDADENIKAMIEALKEIHKHELVDRQHERASIFENEERWRQFTIQMAEQNRHAAKQVVAPVGPEADTLAIGDGKSVASNVNL